MSWFHKNRFQFKNHIFNFTFFCKIKYLSKHHWNSLTSWVFVFLPLKWAQPYSPAFTATLELHFHIFKPKGKIVQNVNFSPVSQKNDLSLKLNPTRQNKSRGMLGFQNRALEYPVIEIYANRDNNTYIKKHNFQ